MLNDTLSEAKILKKKALPNITINVEGYNIQSQNPLKK